MSSKNKLSKKSFSPDEKFMKKAISYALKGVKKGESPFGACIVDFNGNIISVAHNTVLSHNNPTAHAEINAISKAARKLKSINLNNCIIYSTTEPCPMCLSAIHWAKIPIVVYGTSIKDVKELGFSEIPLSNKRFNNIGKLGLTIIPNFMKGECKNLLEKWKSNKKRRIY